MSAFLRKLIFNDFWLKLLSLALAVLIWLIVWKVFLSKEVSPMSAFTHQSIERSYFNVPVFVILPASDVRTVKVEPGEVQVTVQGDPRVLQNIKPQDIKAQVDLTGIESARGLHKRIDIIVPTGVTYTRVSPDEVEVIVSAKK
ncbi:MAG: CdaR family protein [Verrucomicrobiota bacterium]